MEDKYQCRYLKHQTDKKKLLQLISKRESWRDFKTGVDPVFYDGLVSVLDKCPSSCDRKGVEMTFVSDRKNKEILSGLLPGGVGWIHRADRIGLLWGRCLAYKSPNEPMMPYLDAGVIINQSYLFATCSGVKCCYVNPNCNDIDYFKETFNNDTDDYFCGALIFGL
jgi:hypothetical protein